MTQKRLSLLENFLNLRTPLYEQQSQQLKASRKQAKQAKQLVTMRMNAMSNSNLLLVAEAINSLTYLDLKSLIISITDQHEDIFSDEDDVRLANATAEWANDYVESNKDTLPTPQEMRGDTATETSARERY